MFLKKDFIKSPIFLIDVIGASIIFFSIILLLFKSINDKNKQLMKAANVLSKIFIGIMITNASLVIVLNK